MRYDLAAMSRRVRNVRRSSITLRDIVPPATLATDLYRAAYLPVVQLWERAIPAILEEYGRTVKSPVTDQASDGSRLTLCHVISGPVAQPDNAVQKAFTAETYSGRETSAVTADSNQFSARLKLSAGGGSFPTDGGSDHQAGAAYSPPKHDHPPAISARLPTLDNASDLQARLDAATSEVERLFILLDAALKDWTVRVERWQRDKWRGAVLSATGVDIQTLIGPEDVRETLDSYLAWNSRLVRNVSDQLADRISSAVFAGLQNRTPVREVAKTISEATGMARDRSKRIAADQLSKVTSALADERRREAGISVWKWRHSGKRHPREQHRSRDGKLYGDAPADAGGEVNGAAVLEPPARDDLPGRPPYCGCRSQAVLVLD